MARHLCLLLLLLLSMVDSLDGLLKEALVHFPIDLMEGHDRSLYRRVRHHEPYTHSDPQDRQLRPRALDKIAEVQPRAGARCHVDTTKSIISLSVHGSPATAPSYVGNLRRLGSQSLAANGARVRHSMRGARGAHLAHRELAPAR